MSHESFVKNKNKLSRRDPERIDDMLDLFEDIWKAQPDLRFGQLIGNAVEESRLYYMEDDELEDALKEMYGVKDEQRS